MTSILKVSSIQDPQNSNTALSIDTSGRVTTPQRPAFSATFSGDNTIGNMDVVVDVLLNVGNCFDSDTGAFTCPVDGVYSFSADVMTSATGGTSYHTWKFTVNGTAKGSLHHSTSDSGDSYRNTSGSIILSLSANDVVRVNTQQSPPYGNGTSGTGWSSFSGYLVG